MYVLAALHLLRVFFTGSYKRPREANWLIGVSMFALVTGAPVHRHGAQVGPGGLRGARPQPRAGPPARRRRLLVHPEFSADVPLLERLYVAHVAILPGLLLGLFAIHGMLIKRHGISPSPTVPDAPGEVKEPFTHHLRRIGAFALVLLAVVGVLAVVRPPGVGATPVEGIEVTKPLWMFWWLFTLENKIGLKGILYGTGALFGLLFAVPFIDRNPQRWWRKRPVAMAIAGLVLATIIVLTIMEALTTPASHLG